MGEFILKAENLHFSYKSKGETLNILQGLDLELREGETVAIVGASGSGKSTLMHILAGLDSPQSGRVLLCGEEFVSTNKKQDKKRALLRNKFMGFVYQFHHLLPEFSALENVAMPLLIAGIDKKEAQNRAALFLEKVGLSNRSKHRSDELSGGERQRVAIARALVNKPKCLLADEPTGNLDNENAKTVFALMQDLISLEGSAMIMVSHDLNLAKKMGKTFTLSNGKLQKVKEEN